MTRKFSSFINNKTTSSDRSLLPCPCTVCVSPDLLFIHLNTFYFQSPSKLSFVDFFFSRVCPCAFQGARRKRVRIHSSHAITIITVTSSPSLPSHHRHHYHHIITIITITSSPSLPSHHHHHYHHIITITAITSSPSLPSHHHHHYHHIIAIITITSSLSFRRGHRLTMGLFLSK